MKITKLPKIQEDEVRTKVEALGLTVRSTRKVEHENTQNPEQKLIEELATIELADGSSLTIDLTDPDHEERIIKARDRVESHIRNGTRVRKHP